MVTLMLIKFGVDVDSALDITELFLQHFKIKKTNIIFLKKNTNLIRIFNDPSPRKLKSIWIFDKNNCISFDENQLRTKDIYYHLQENNDNDNDIHIVLCYWKRLQNLETQLNSLNQQTLANNIHLHLLNNNPEIKLEISKLIIRFAKLKLHFKITLFHYDNRYSCYQRFFYIKDHLIKQFRNKIEYVIIIDDDRSP